MTPAGFPHSEILGSKPVCGSPRLIGACRVLHRRSAPRHPPFTLSSLAIKSFRRENDSRNCDDSILLSKIRGRTREIVRTGRSWFHPRTRDAGGADRVRTDDLRLAKPPLSRLSYSPGWLMVGLDRFELSTPRLSSVCSDQLSYRPDPEASSWMKRPIGSLKIEQRRVA